MARHEVTEKELNEWLCREQWQPFASSASATSNKRLDVDSSDSVRAFRVIDRGETIFLGTDKAAAIAAYNSAP